MPKIMVAILASIFLLGGGLGFSFGQGIKTASRPVPTPVSPANQANFILVRIDDHNLQHPHLVSVWGMFINHSDFTSLVFKRIYPENASEESNTIANAFALTAEKNPTDKFYTALQSLDVPAAEIIVVDNLLLRDLVSSLTGPSTLGNYDFPSTGNSLAVAQRLDRDLMVKACNIIQDPQQGAPQDARSQSQGHTLANALTSSPDELKRWKGLVTSLHFASCETLASP